MESQSRQATAKICRPLRRSFQAMPRMCMFMAQMSASSRSGSRMFVIANGRLRMEKVST